MFFEGRFHTSAMRSMVIVASIVLLGPIAAPLHAQVQFNLPVCTPPPLPFPETRPQAVTDILGTVISGQPFTVASATLMANDTGTSALIITGAGPRSSHGGTIVESVAGMYTYTSAPLFSGGDAFTYELEDATGEVAIGVAKITVLPAPPDTIAPTVAITSPGGGSVFGVTPIQATASDNVGVVGVTFFDGIAAIGVEVTVAPYAVNWNTAAVADGPHSLTAVARDAAGNSATSALVAVTVANNSTVPNIVGLTAAAAQSALAIANLTVGSVTSVNSTTVPAGQVISQAPGAGTTLARNSAVSYVLSLGAPVVAVPTVQASVFADGVGARTTPAFSTTTAGEVLIALAASDGPTAGVNNQNLTISGAGLTWARVKRAATQRGVAEIWTATAATTLSNVSVTSTQSVTTVNGLAVNQSLQVIAFTGAAGVGASNLASGVSGAPTVSLVTQGAGSVVYGVGIDFDRAIARTVPAGQTKVHEFLAPSGDTMWMQSLNGTTGAIGSTATLNDTAPTTDQWNYASVEILSGNPPSAVTVPSVVGLTQVAAQSAITGAGLTVGAITSSSSPTVPAGSVISQSPAGASSALAGSAVSLVISTGTPPPVPTAQVTVFKDGSGAQTTPAFSTTAPGEVLVAFATSDGPTSGVNNQFLTVSGAGLTWTRVVRAATSRGVAEIWTATAPTVLSGVTVTSTQSVTTVLSAPVNQSLTVVAFTNASGIGASNVASAATGAATISLVAQAANSAVYAVGNDFDQAIARVIPAGQTKVHEFLAPSGDTFWVQASSSTTTAAGASVTLRVTSPTADQWNFAVIEIKR